MTYSACWLRFFEKKSENNLKLLEDLWLSKEISMDEAAVERYAFKNWGTKRYCVIVADKKGYWLHQHDFKITDGLAFANGQVALAQPLLKKQKGGAVPKTPKQIRAEINNALDDISDRHEAKKVALIRDKKVPRASRNPRPGDSYRKPRRSVLSSLFAFFLGILCAFFGLSYALNYDVLEHTMAYINSIGNE